MKISELPIGVWTQQYKKNVLQQLPDGTDKDETPLISDFKEYHTDTAVRFMVKMTTDQFKKAENVSLHKFFKLSKNLSLNSMVLFDLTGCLKRYENVMEILKDFLAFV